MSEMAEVVVRCEKCGQHCSVREAYQRERNPGRCASCNGAFVVAHIAFEPQSDLGEPMIGAIPWGKKA